MIAVTAIGCPIAWNVISSYKARDPIFTYSYRRTNTCRLLTIRPSFLVPEHACDKTLVDGVELWTHNTPLIVFSDETAPNVTILVDRSLADNVIGEHDYDSNVIRLNGNKCFHVWDQVCWTFYRAHRYLMRAIAVFVFVSSYIVYMFHDGAKSRLFVWVMSVVTATALMIEVSQASCVQCFSLRTTIAHEFGHAVGLLHTDGPNGTNVGCGGDARFVPGASDSGAIMRSVMTREPTFRLSYDDFSAVWTLYGKGRCIAPTAPVKSTRFALWSRVFVLSLIVYMWTTALWMAAHKKLALRCFASCRARLEVRREPAP